MESLKELGFEFTEAGTPWKTDEMVGIEVQAPILGPIPEELTQLILSRTTIRGSKVHVGDFRLIRKIQSKDINVLGFLVAVVAPSQFWWSSGGITGNKVAMTFADFCWKCSNGTTTESARETDLPIPEGAMLGDLTWSLPAKFVDDLVETLYALNQDVLEGRMQDSWLVGPCPVGGAVAAEKPVNC